MLKESIASGCQPVKKLALSSCRNENSVTYGLCLTQGPRSYAREISRIICILSDMPMVIRVLGTTG